MEARSRQAYLQRIGIDHVVPVSPEGLECLHVAHLLNIPFENLDILLGHPLRLDLPALLGKLVDARRGGLCYELNHAFAGLLAALGFEVGLLSARVYGDSGYGPDFDHLLLRVDFPGGACLADVGFGDSFLRPLALSGEICLQGGDAFRLVHEDASVVLQRRRPGGSWLPRYRFRPDVTHPIDAFAAMCDVHQHAPDAHFAQRPLCTLARPDGRITLSGRRLIASLGADRLEQPVRDAEALGRWLARHFGVVLDAGSVSTLFAAARD